MSLLNCQNVSFGYGDREILREAAFEIAKGDKIGLIGPNGCGKTTLFKLISGELEPGAGAIIKPFALKIGCVEQHACAGSKRNVYDELLSVYLPLMELEAELEEIHRKLENPQNATPEMLEKQSRLDEKFRSLGGLTFRAMAHSCLKGLGFSQSDEYLPVSSLSGGQRTKLCLGKLLLSEPDLMLLDEPTNHLDINSVEWLEDFLSKFKGALLVVSHDRYFLDRVTTRTFEISGKRLYTGKGGYSDFVKDRALRLETQRREYEKAKIEIERIEKMIDQQRSFGRERNFITIASKEKQIERIKADMPELPPSVRDFKLKFECTVRCGDDALVCENLSKRYGEKELYSGVSFRMFRGDKLFLLGPNGCGKSTVLGQIINTVPKDTGFSRFGVNVKTGFFEQTQSSLMTDKTILYEIYDRFPTMTVPEIRKHLGAFNFRGDDYEKKMNELSGGERARVALLILMLEKPNFLILDEPTNHLDIASREVLEQALEGFEGTLLCVSHDRYFVNRLARGLLVFDGASIRRFDGNYDDYVNTLASAAAGNKAAVEKKPNEYKLRKEREASERKRKARISKIESELEELNAELETVNYEMSQPENASDYEKITALTARAEELTAAINSLETEWLELTE